MGGAAAATALAPPLLAAAARQTVVNEHRNICRNDPCWCGSGKKFKRCHKA